MHRKDNPAASNWWSRRRSIIVLLALCTMLAIGSSVLYQKLERVRSDLVSLQQHARLMRSAMPTSLPALRDPSRLEALDEEVQQTCGDVDRLHAEAVGLRYMGGLLPLAGQHGSRLAQVMPLLDLGQTICDVTLTHNDDLHDLARSLSTEGGQRMDGIGPVLLDLAQKIEQRLPRYSSDLQRIQAARAAVDRRALDGWLQPAAYPIAQLDNVLETALQVSNQAPVILPLARSLLGEQGPRTYLVMGQNSHELRATGGFTSGIGALVIERGKLTSSEFRYSYDWDTPRATRVLPPEPYQRYLGVATLFLRDANWWPDFPTTARQVQRLWNLYQGGSVDGTIAIDDAAVQRVLDVTGPVDLPQWGLQVGAGDFYAQIKDRAPTNALKSNVIPEIYRGVFQKLLALDPERIPALLRVINELVAEKHVQVYLADSSGQDFVKKYGADGSIRPAENSDYLFIVDTTVTYSEVSQLIEKSVDLSVNIIPEDSLVERTLTLRYRNRYSSELPPGQQHDADNSAVWDPVKRQLVREAPGYWGDWLRIYLPAGSQVVNSDGFKMDAQLQNESGKLVVAGFVEVRPGQETTIVVQYHGPLGIANCEAGYPIQFQKQAGALPYQIDIRLSSSAADCSEAHQQVMLDRDELVRVEPHTAR